MTAKKRTIHLVSTVPLGRSLFRRGIDKLIAKTKIIPPLHRYGIDSLIPWRRPIRSPHSISINLLHELKKFGTVRFYSLYEKGIINMGPDDIFIGQPVPEGGFGLNFRPNTDDHESITSRTLRKYKDSNHNKFLMTPFASDPRLVSWMKDLVLINADKIILIATGKIWTKDWATTPFGTIDPRLVLRVDNAIDPEDYPLVKKKFNPPEKRKFLYIGHAAWYKNTEELERIAEQMPGFIGGHIGGGVIKGWKKITEFADLTPQFMTKIAEEYDIFINTSSADAQATTILTSICFGFPIACTHETGYDYPSIVQLDTNDTESNIRKLTAMKNMDELELRKMVKENMELVIKNHLWDNFLNKIITFMGLQSSGK